MYKVHKVCVLCFHKTILILIIALVLVESHVVYEIGTHFFIIYLYFVKVLLLILERFVYAPNLNLIKVVCKWILSRKQFMQRLAYTIIVLHYLRVLTR